MKNISGLQEVGHINNTVVSIIRYFQCLHLMYSEVACVLVSSETQVQPRLILKPGYLPHYLSFLVTLLLVTIREFIFLKSD